MFFKLNPECYLVSGKKRSVVHNLQTKGIIWLDESESIQLQLTEAGAPVKSMNGVHHALAEKGWGFFSETVTFVDKVRPLNAFREKRLWEEAPSFDIAVLKITNTCNLECSDCGRSFCPICMVEDSVATGNSAAVLSSEWIDVIESISDAGASSMLFTGGECTMHPDLAGFIERALQLGMSVAIQTNGLTPLDELPSGISICVFLAKAAFFDDVASNLDGREQVEFLCNDFEINIISDRLKPGWTARRVSSEKPAVSRDALIECGLDRFFVRKNRDSCLSGKMFILHDGSLVPCFEDRNTVLGNVIHDDFTALYQVLINDYWIKPFSESAGATKCGQCEFTYACNVCRYLDTAQHCLYEPAQGIWK